MLDTPEVITTISGLPFISILMGAVGILWIVFSLATTYHWIAYSRNIVMTIIVLVLYYGVSLFLIGSFITYLSAYV